MVAAGGTAKALYDIAMSQKPIHRRGFLKYAGIAAAAVGMALTGVGEVGKKQAISNMDEEGERIKHLEQIYDLLAKNRKISKEELNALENDSHVKKSLVISGRNTVMAEGITRVVNQHALNRVGVVIGTAHYNLPDYVDNPQEREKLRVLIEEKYREPEIRQYRPID